MYAKVLKRVLFILPALLVITPSLSAKETKWHDLKEVVKQYGSYTSRDYHIRDDIIALEIRTYGFRDGHQTYKDIPVAIYRVPVESIDKRVFRRFRNASPNLKQKDEIRNPPDFRGDKSRAFIIANDKKIYRMSTISDVIYYLGDIGRPAEAYLVWWMHSRYSGMKDTKSLKSRNRPIILSKKYRLTSRGYEMLIKYRISNDYIKNRGRESCSEYQDFTDKVIIDKHGRISYFKQLKKSKIKTECSEILCGGPPL